MKKQTAVFGVLAAVLLVGGTALRMLCDLPRITGGLMKEPDAYVLDVQYMLYAFAIKRQGKSRDIFPDAV